MTSILCFTDCETDSTRLDAQIYEIGVIRRQVTFANDGEIVNAETTTHRWMLPITPELAEPTSLNVGRFHRRHPQGNAFDRSNNVALSDLSETAVEVARLTHNATLIGIGVDFDAVRLVHMILGTGVPSWNYRLADIRALMAGRLQAPLPWITATLAKELGVRPPTAEERHTALGDAAWSMRCWDAVYGVGGS